MQVFWSLQPGGVMMAHGRGRPRAAAGAIQGGAMRVISVKCPKCRATMEIDSATGVVLRHHEEVRSKPGADFLGTRLRELEQEKARREAVVEHGREREKNRQGEFDKLFRKVKEEHSSGSR
jgi:hypothetical protein